MPISPTHSLPPALAPFLNHTVQALHDELGDMLVSVILHGSLAMNAFFPPKSDIDLLIITDRLSEEKRLGLYDLLADRHLCRPYAGGLEACVVDKAVAMAPRHPVPQQLKFSETTQAAQARPAPDEDLIVHLTVAKNRGIALYGPPPGELIGLLRRDDYLRAIQADIEWILTEENLLISPYYGVLNLCRWEMIKRHGNADILPSKKAGGLWGRRHLPASFHGLIDQSQAAYMNTEWPRDIVQRQQAGGPWRRDALVQFRNFMRERQAARATIDNQGDIENMPTSHEYTVTVEWTGNLGQGTAGYRAYTRDHTISANGKPAIIGSSDTAFLGDASRWNPEELLLASVSACHKLWYLHLCADAGVQVLRYRDQAQGTMETHAGGGAFTQIVLHPEITISREQDIARATELHHQAHAKCFIANSVNFPITFEPKVGAPQAGSQ